MAKNIQVNDRNVRVQIWDTAGQEAFRSITRSYYKSSTCAFIIYDITNKKSFSNVVSWLNECREMCFRDILICLVGNKTDLENKRIVSKEEGQKFAEDNGLLFFETSAQDGTNIEEMFTQATSNIVNRVESGKIQLDTHNTGIKIGKYPNKEVEQALEEDERKDLDDNVIKNKKLKGKTKIGEMPYKKGKGFFKIESSSIFFF